MKYRVNIDEANEAKAELSAIIDGKDDRLMNRVGAFATLFKLDTKEYSDPVLVLKTEEPGTKQVIAFANDRIESVCHDMINHLINDCIAMGAKPLAVQDLVVCGKLRRETLTRIVTALTVACQEQGCVLTGGETTEQPDIVSEETYILGSSIVGIVNSDAIIDGSNILPGDIVIGIGSSGPHTNGYTLIRDLLTAHPDIANEPVGGTTFLEAILTPHRCYYNSVKTLFPYEVVGLAHITGGGIKENLNRILPQNVNAEIDLGLYKVPQIFTKIKRIGNVGDDEMIRTFNLGVGMAVVARPEKERDVLETLRKAGEDAFVVGEISDGSGNVNCNGKVKFED